MAVYDHEEQEQLDALKAWWREHGNKAVNLALAVAVVAAAASGWKWWQGKQGAEAAAIYGQLLNGAEKHDVKIVRDMAVELADKYAGTVYAGMGALVAARVQLDADDAKNAKAQLAWAAEHASDAALRDLARLRLAGLLLDDKSYDEALKLLDKAPQPSFVARYAEMKGDVMLAQGKKAEARTAYQAALDTLESDRKAAPAASDSPAAQREAMYRELLQAKLESLGGKA